jgi:ATP-binding cassette subfamily F protein uup
LALPSNFLVLDEPTNDLDLETLDLLQEMLMDYPGTLIVVSHDRDFLDRVATSVIVAENDGKWQEYAGGYSDMVAQRGSGIAVLAGTKTHLSSTRAPAADSAHSSKPASPPAKKGRLSFKQKHALETLPARMDGLQKMKAQLQARLEDPEFYSKDADGFAKVMAAMAKVEADLSATEEEWLALEVLREELEG